MAKNNISHKLVVFSTVIASFTQLRFSLFGIAELILLILFLSHSFKSIRYSVLKNLIFSKFWLSILTTSIIGLAYNINILSHATGEMKSMYFDFISYIFILITCFYLERSILEKKLDPHVILKSIFYLSSISYTILFILSFYIDNILGYSLVYFGYFSPLSDNVHQTAMFLVILPFIGLWCLTKNKQLTYKIITLFLIVMDVIMSISTGVFKANLAISLGFIVLIYVKSSLLSKGKYLLLFIIISLIGLSIAFLYFDLIKILSEVFIDNDINEGRAFLYTEGIKTAMTSPIFGLGTGAHIYIGYGHFKDAHQTILTIFLQAGIIGVFFYFRLISKIIRSLFMSPMLFSAFIAIFVYSLGGDILRRLPIWIMLILIFYVGQPMYNNFRTNSKAI